MKVINESEVAAVAEVAAGRLGYSAFRPNSSLT